MTEFEKQKLTWVSPQLKARIEVTVWDCLDKAQARFGVDKVTKIPEIRYNTKGKTAGWACWNGGRPYIDINPILLNENVEEVVGQTVPHEVAHIVVDEVYDQHNRCYIDPHSMRRRQAIEPHGFQWQEVMRLFGKVPHRCHQMDVTTVTKLRNGGLEHIYKCKCNGERAIHKMSKIKHNRIQRGGGYICRRCRATLVFDKTV